MFELVKPDISIDFVGKARIYIIISLVAIIISLIVVLTKGFNVGIDFVGGTVVQVRFSESIELERVRTAISPAIPTDFVIQNFGGVDSSEVLIRIAETSKLSLQDLSTRITAQLSSQLSSHSPSIQKTEQVGPQAGSELRNKAFYAMLYALVGILIYIAVRFQPLFGVCAVIALTHDVIISLGAYSLSGKELNITVMAAILTVVGYSLNDTIVIFDRMRENMKLHANLSWKELINSSLNETLSRTIVTSALTFLAVLSLYLFGGEVINGFAFMMLVGILVGTYSSLCIAAIVVYLVKTRKRNEPATAK
ncbi:protein translocase subunit SecF [Deferribacterales bacterium RsTz2092]|nr:protein-export membrane protein SecF [Deferribacterales bacterium]